MHYASTLTLALTLFSSISGVTVDGDFESFKNILEARNPTGRHKDFLSYITLNAYHKDTQGNPWTYEGRFGVAKSGHEVNSETVNASSGEVFAILQRESLIKQNVTGLIQGKQYTVSLSRRDKKNGFGGNNIRVSLGGKEVYSEDGITYKREGYSDGEWVKKTSSAFTAVSDVAELKIWSTSKGSAIAVFIDNVSVQEAVSIQDLGFESYLAAISNNNKTHGRWLGHAEAAQEPWTYTGGFRPAKTGNAPYGSVESVDGEVYAVLLNQASISQSLSGLVEGTDYVFSWFQRGRPNDDKAGNDINLSIGDLPIYTQDGIYDEGEWEAKSVVYTATSETAMLKIWTTNPDGGHRSVFIDAISFNRALIQDPGFDADPQDSNSWKLTQLSPWTSTGWFRLGKDGNSPWGGVESVDGSVYAIFKKKSSISQTVSGLVPGSKYALSWSQRARPGSNNDGNDINLSIEGSPVFFETNISAGAWEAKTSGVFTATSETADLKIWTTNPLGGDRSVFVDAISVNKVD